MNFEMILFRNFLFKDRCMELREQAGNENMLTVEKRLERQKAKAEHRLRQIASASERQTVFDFINSKLTKNTTAQNSQGITKSVKFYSIIKS